MPPVTTQQIKSAIITVVQKYPLGIRNVRIFRAVKEILPSVRPGQFSGVLNGFRHNPQRGIKLIARGLYIYEPPFQNDQDGTDDFSNSPSNNNERDFYQSFATYLETRLKECTKAVPLGGNVFGDRWGTPDVIGKNEARKSNIIQHETEIISAEIKTDESATALITAFGQACAYKLFSHKVYLVIPKTAKDENKRRIESLCLIFGIGLIFFDRNNQTEPNFEICVRASKHEPNWRYVNEYAVLIEHKLW